MPNYSVALFNIVAEAVYDEKIRQAVRGHRLSPFEPKKALPGPQAEASFSEASQCPNYSLDLFNIVTQPVYDEKIRQESRRQAEASLSEASQRPNYSLAIYNIVAQLMVRVSVSSGGSLLVSSKGLTSNNPEWNVKELQRLYLDLHAFLFQEQELRRQAEASLFKASQCPNYSLALFNIVAQLVYNEKIRQAEPRRQAEASLSEASQCPNYSLALFNIVAQPVYDEKIRQAIQGHRPGPMDFFKLGPWARLGL
ncbi:hypothetical protein L3X38_013709 [Prunus dulcis]|uniref:Uncharacterized protein n=1 Tax=Prunus dulcis TaxID=3755 RepID=A0AAD4ZGE8_PRUDU|nr:hypothetical protein L3X38_013709 [Prunus dulcis]